MAKFDEIDGLMTQGYAALEELDHEQAIKIGKKLLQIKHTSGFEILARAYALDDRHDEAILLLEEGMKEVPPNWILWAELGILYSDKERFQDAYQAFQQALASPKVNASAVYYNQAIAMGREGRYADALMVTKKITCPDILREAVSFKITLLNDLEKYSSALELAEQAISAMPPLSEIESSMELSNQLGEIQAEIARAYWEGAHDEEKAWQYAIDSTLHAKDASTAFSIIREINNEQSSDAKYFKLTLQGEMPEPEEGSVKPDGLIVIYHVVADTQEEALSFVLRLEPEDIGPSLRIEEVEVIEVSDDYLKGVYFRSVYCSFPGDDPEAG